LETIADNIDFICSPREVSALLCWSNSEALYLLCFCSLCLVSWEHILRAVNICNEFEVIDLVVVAAITVVPDDQLEGLFVVWHQVEHFHHAQELCLGDVQ